MRLNWNDPLEILLVVAAFGLVFAAWIGGVLLLAIRRRSKAKRIERRLGLSGDQGRERVISLWLDDGEAKTTVLDRGKEPLRERVNRTLRAAGCPLSLGALSTGLGAAGFFLLLGSYLAVQNLLPGLGVFGGLLTGLWLFLKQRIHRGMAAFERQFVDALDLAARCLRAGHPLTGAFQLIAEEIPPPVGPLFSEICQQQGLGASLETALQSVAARSSSEDLRLFATSVIIQLRSGGNLADMMDRLAHVVRDRLRLNRRVRVLTAQTQFSKRVLLALPFFMFFVLNLVSPEYMVPLYTTSGGRGLLAIGVFGLALGAWFMSRISVLKH